MSPTIVYDAKTGTPVFVVGAAGGKTIIMQVAKAIIARLDWGMAPRDAIGLGLIYFNQDGVILEQGTALEAMEPALEKLGNKVSIAKLGLKANAAAWDGSKWVGAADPRSVGRRAANNEHGRPVHARNRIGASEQREKDARRGACGRLEHFPNLVAMFFARARDGGRRAVPVAQGGRRLGLAELGRGREAGREPRRRRSRRSGCKPGDRVMLVSENRPEWCISDLAIMAAGCVTVPTYITNTERDHTHILENSGARAVIVSTAKLARALLPAAIRASESQGHHRHRRPARDADRDARLP